MPSNEKSRSENVTVTIDLKEKDAEFLHRQNYAEKIADRLRSEEYKLPSNVNLEMVIVRASEGTRLRGVGLSKRGGWSKLWVKWTVKRGDTVLVERLEKCEGHGYMGLKNLVDKDAGEKSLLGRLQEDMIRNIQLKAPYMLKKLKKPMERPDVTCL